MGNQNAPAARHAPDPEIFKFKTKNTLGDVEDLISEVEYIKIKL